MIITWTFIIVTGLLMQRSAGTRNSRGETIEAEVLIQATPSKVWGILTDFNSYSDWNPFVKSASGNPVKGEKLKVKIHPPDSKMMQFKPTVITAEKNRELSWLGHFLFPGLFDGEHSFILKDNGNGTVCFIQKEKFRGILVPIFKNMIRNNTKRGFEIMNEALKQRAEND